jgi:hypothetical protein
MATKQRCFAQAVSLLHKLLFPSCLSDKLCEKYEVSVVVDVLKDCGAFNFWFEQSILGMIEMLGIFGQRCSIFPAVPLPEPQITQLSIMLNEDSQRSQKMNET